VHELDCITNSVYSFTERLIVEDNAKLWGDISYCFLFLYHTTSEETSHSKWRSPQARKKKSS